MLMKNLWHFTRYCNYPWRSMPLYVCIAFANPEMTRRIREERDLVVRVIGRCVEALVVNKVAANSNTNVPNSDDEVACLSGILGTKRDDVERLLQDQGTVQFTNIMFLALDDFYSFTLEPVPSYVLDVVQRTFGALSQALPRDLKDKMNDKMRPNQTDTPMNISNGERELVPRFYPYRLKMYNRTSDGCNVQGHFTHVDEETMGIHKRVQ